MPSNLSIAHGHVVIELSRMARIASLRSSFGFDTSDITDVRLAGHHDRRRFMDIARYDHYLGGVIPALDRNGRSISEFWDVDDPNNMVVIHLRWPHDGIGIVYVSADDPRGLVRRLSQYDESGVS